ncbi:MULTISPECIES: TetR/AcrR family transcriptional regulator [unclassified Crossiella]|uniref:TetR/AcrR family transcriptional regulator n=1 Tax=unclassified Crossiella TaxID=2620835 RepID=UPI001FFFEFD0|nr:MULTISPECIES: TetR family transcriptional regulator [unclassified Crossiella]MCK2236486.1 TetR family transcriptional regulator [Crossiella sp. S99.2]MCK2250153.1 TetR family transcriptional regulator [Crossiella sp. S99.1]
MSETPGRHPASTPKGERRRHALIEAAAALLAEGGFDAIRHRAVAERAELPLASTTYYFSSLDDLVAAAIEHSSRAELTFGRTCLDELSDRDGPVCAADLVELMLDLLLGRASRDGGLEPVLLRYERLVGSARRPFLTELMRGLGEELMALLTELFAHSGTPVSRERLNELVALVDGAVVNALIESNPDPRDGARRMLRANLPGRR